MLEGSSTEAVGVDAVSTLQKVAKRGDYRALFLGRGGGVGSLLGLWLDRQGGTDCVGGCGGSVGYWSWGERNEVIRQCCVLRGFEGIFFLNRPIASSTATLSACTSLFYSTMDKII